MYFIVYAFKGQVQVFAGEMKIVSRSSCRTSAILKYFLSPAYAVSTSKEPSQNMFKLMDMKIIAI